MHDSRLRLALAAVAALALAGPAPAAAQEGSLVKNLLSGAGILPTPNTDIDYRERAPLVVPPKAELRAPEAAGSPERAASWPNDPDVQRRRNAAAEARRPASVGDVNGNRIPAANPDHKPDRRSAEAAPPYATDGGSSGVVMSPDRLRAFKAPGKPDDVALSAGEPPPRRALTDPPSDYRRATEKVRTGSEPVRDTEREEMDPTAFNRRQRGR